MSFLGRCVGTGPSKIACTGYLVLDVTMGEDDCPIYRGDAAEILACIRHMGLNMLRASYGDFWCMGEIEKVAYPAD